ncbi:hypothetical protein ACFL1H_08295, partial [Nanoarchaeota archaeon]
IISDEDIDKGIEKRVLELGREEYNHHIKSLNGAYTTYPDHVLHPGFLAYALKKEGYFSEKEINKMVFSFGDSLKEFKRIYCGDDFLESYRLRILEYNCNRDAREKVTVED